MGCLCSSKNIKKKPTPINDPDVSNYPISEKNSGINLGEQQIKVQKSSIDRKRNEFIDNFFNKNLGLNPLEKRNTIFITNLNKKMRISKDLITIEEDLILKTNLDSPNSHFNNFWIFLDANINDIISKEIYIDDIKVNDTQFETKNSSIKLEFENTFNNQTRKIRIIEKIRNKFDNYGSNQLILDKQGIATRFLIYLDDDLTLDDISNKNYVLNKDLNLAYFEGITSAETENYHGFIYYSKYINYQIYKYIPELSKDSVQNIIRKQEMNNQPNLNYLAKYKKIVMTGYGQDIDEIDLMKLSNYNDGKYLTSFSVGLYKDIKNEIDLVELNGKSFAYRKNNGSIEFNNIKVYNNQYIEIHLKYKYYTNEGKDIYRQENILLSNIQNTYCKAIVQIPDNYVIIATKDKFNRSPEIKNTYFYQGISKEKDISETFKICFEKAKWDIEYEYILEAQNNISNCEFTLNKIFKGGNLKDIQYDINNKGANLIDSGDKYTFKYTNLNSNKAKLNFKIKVQNSTSNYFYNENTQDYIEQIPQNEIQFFQNLSSQIISSDKSNFPNHKKIGKWVHNHIKYNLQLTGQKFTAMEIYKNKQGVCEHYTKLYNTLLNAYGIKALKVSGYAKDITEYNTKVKKKNNEENQSGNPTERHAWTLAKIDGEWVPLDATWDLFDKCVPITHVFENYGDGGEKIKYNSDNQVKFKLTKESVKYIKN